MPVSSVGTGAVVQNGDALPQKTTPFEKNPVFLRGLYYLS